MQTSVNYLFLIIVIGLAAVLANPTTRAVCPEDYSPCVCDLTANGLEVTCVDLALADVVDVFFRTQNLFLYSVSLTTSATGLVALPADLLSDKRAQNIQLNCPSAASPKLSLTIDPASFEFTRFNTTRFEIHDCDLAGQTDMKFLNGFVALNTLHLENTLNVEAMENLPSLPALKELAVVNCTGLGNVAFPDLTPTRLERLHLDGNGLNNEAVANILISLGSSSSVSSLKLLSLANNALTKIPTIASFSQLITYELSYNAVPFMSLSTLIFGSPVNFVGLKNLSLAAIESDAFQGNFTYAQVNLENNKLTEFREDVFKSMLQQMTIQPPAIGGQVLVTGNPFGCGCPLAWLIRDNQILLPSVKNGVCGEFFRFEDLNPDAYGNC